MSKERSLRNSKGTTDSGAGRRASFVHGECELLEVEDGAEAQNPAECGNRGTRERSPSLRNLCHGFIGVTYHDFLIFKITSDEA